MLRLETEAPTLSHNNFERVGSPFTQISAVKQEHEKTVVPIFPTEKLDFSISYFFKFLPALITLKFSWYPVGENCISATP